MINIVIALLLYIIGDKTQHQSWTANSAWEDPTSPSAGCAAAGEATLKPGHVRHEVESSEILLEKLNVILGPEKTKRKHKK